MKQIYLKHGRKINSSISNKKTKINLNIILCKSYVNGSIHLKRYKNPINKKYS
jgi:hypothetical protein